MCLCFFFGWDGWIGGGGSVVLCVIVYWFFLWILVVFVLVICCGVDGGYIVCLGLSLVELGFYVYRCIYVVWSGWWVGLVVFLCFGC